MRLRRSTTDVALSELEEQRAKLAGEIEQAEAELAQAAAGVASATRSAAIAHLDGGDRLAAAKLRQEAETRRNTAAQSLENLQVALVEQHSRLEARRADLHAEQRAAEVAKLRRQRERRTEASESCAALATQLVSAREKLEQEREAVRALERSVTELGGDRFVDDIDEAERPPGVSELAEFLAAWKPHRPLAEREQSRLKAEVDAENAVRRERIRVLDETRRFATQSWRRPGEQERIVERFFAQVPAELREEARELYERERAALLERPHALVR